jgi:hypothetical protein
MSFQIIRNRLFVAVVTLLLSSPPIFGCSIVVHPMRKDFRKAANLFQGKVLSVEEIGNKQKSTPLKTDFVISHKVTFQVVRSWKGRKSGQIDVYLDDYCLCPSRKFEFRSGKEFLVHVDKNGYADTCNLYFYDFSIRNGERSEYLDHLTSQLDSFWFRTWARIYPF